MNTIKNEIKATANVVSKFPFMYKVLKNGCCNKCVSHYITNNDLIHMYNTEHYICLKILINCMKTCNNYYKDQQIQIILNDAVHDANQDIVKYLINNKFIDLENIDYKNNLFKLLISGRKIYYYYMILKNSTKHEDTEIEENVIEYYSNKFKDYSINLCENRAVIIDYCVKKDKYVECFEYLISKIDITEYTDLVLSLEDIKMIEVMTYKIILSTLGSISQIYEDKNTIFSILPREIFYNELLRQYKQLMAADICANIMPAQRERIVNLYKS